MLLANRVDSWPHRPDARVHARLDAGLRSAKSSDSIITGWRGKKIKQDLMPGGSAAAWRDAQSSGLSADAAMPWRLTMRKMMLAGLAILIATLLVPIEPVSAQNYPWCQQRGDGTTNCGFVTYEQCMAKQGSFCYRNPMYQPSAGEPRSRRSARGRHE
jgi:Protein of unknown function (DUF3551)